MREFIRAYWLFIAIGLAGLLLAMRFIEPAPPSQITFAAGAPGGAYYAYAERYQRLLGEKGVTVTILETAGSVENLRMVRDGDADAALVQGGIANPVSDPDIRALGGLFPEPAWVFARAELGITDFGELKTQRLAIGMPGSGTRALAIQMQSEWGSDWSSQATLAMTSNKAFEALLVGEIDAAFFSADIEASYIQALLRDETVTLVPFPRAPAIAQRYPALAPQTLLRGVLDIGEDLPQEDVPLIAPIAQILVPKEVHPAIEAVLLDAAHAIHSEGSLLARAGTFPDPTLTDVPLSGEAERYYRNGPTALRRWFSFGMANFLERSWVLLIPLLTLMIPLARVAPPIYRWRVRRRIYIWYSDLRALEVRGRTAKTDGEKAAVMAALEKLQKDAGEIEVPLSYTDDLYRLRNHIEFVEGLLERLGGPDMTETGGPLSV